LIPLMFVHGDDKPVREIVGHRPDGLGQFLIIVWVCAVCFANSHLYGLLNFGANSTDIGMTSRLRQVYFVYKDLGRDHIKG